MLAQQDRDVAHEGNEADHAANNVFFAAEEGLALRVELGVVREVVVTLGKQTEGCFAGSLSASPSTLAILVLGAASLKTHASKPSSLALGSSALATCKERSTYFPPYLLTTLCTIGISLPLTL